MGVIEISYFVLRRFKEMYFYQELRRPFMAYIFFRGMPILTLRKYFEFTGTFKETFLLLLFWIEKFISALATNIKNMPNIHKFY